MNFDQLSDSDIEQLLKMPKRVTNPKARWQDKPGHRQRNFTVKSESLDFVLYQRQNVFDEEDFSCGIRLVKPDGSSLTLMRCNGMGHKHGEIEYACHIHKATEKAISMGKKPERFAYETQAYHSLEGALCELMKLCAISGLSGVRPDEPDLFN